MNDLHEAQVGALVPPVNVWDRGSEKSNHAEGSVLPIESRSLFQWTGTPWLDPVQLSAKTVASAATDVHSVARVLAVLDRLTEDDYLTYLRAYYRSGLDKFGSYWKYADLLTVLHAATSLIQPKNYLEIGVRRGRSLAVVAAAHPRCELYGFDMWMADYAGMPNPGPEFVEQELARLGPHGPLRLITGDSRQTVPSFLSANPEQYFDLINVDGDHSEAGARADLVAVLPRLRRGGVIVLDDIVHPQHRYLETLWDQMVGADPCFTTYKYRDLGYGVALAVRRRDP